MPTQDEECPFCEIVREEDPSVREVLRNEHVVAFFPTEPAVLGHVLLIPRRHTPNIWQLTVPEATQLSQAALDLSRTIQAALQPEGLNIIQSNGEAATQTVNHLHVHLVPRWEADHMGPIWPHETNFSNEQKDETLQAIRSSLVPCQSEPQPLSPEDRRKHLDYLQSVIARQSTASSSTKSWLLPVVTATFGFALAQGSWSLAALGIVAVLLFAYLDANYLRSERRFRKLYITVTQSAHSVPNFTLDPNDAEEIEKRSRWRQFCHSYIPGWDVWKSWSILPFYLALVLLGVGVLLHAGTSGSNTKPDQENEQSAVLAPHVPGSYLES